jgi:hypothetical protein
VRLSHLRWRQIDGVGGGAAARTPQKAWACDRNRRRKAERTGGARSETQKGLKIPLPARRVCVNKNRIADFGLLPPLARVGFSHGYVSRAPYGHCGPAEQQDRQADENGCRKEIKPAHIMRLEQGLEPLRKAQPLRFPALAAME